MAKYLAKELRKYYFRKGNTMVFSNGDTLNKLALRMWEKMGYQSVDPSVLARVLSGERLFTNKQLKVFINVLNLDYYQAANIYDAYKKHFELKAKAYGFYDDFSMIDQIGYLETSLAKISGNMRLIHQQTLKIWLYNLIEQTEMYLSKTRQEYLRIKLSEILTECYYKLFVIRSSTVKDWRKEWPKVLKEFRKLSSLAKLTNNAEYFEHTKVVHHQYYYFLQDYKNAEIQISKIDLDKIHSDFAKVDILRGALVTTAATYQVSEYKTIKRIILSFSKTLLSNDLKAKTYNGLSRSETYLGNQSLANKYLEKAWESHSKSKSEEEYMVRKLQIMLGELFIASKFNNTNKDRNEKIITKGLSIALSYGHNQYADGFKNYSNIILS